MLCCRSAVLDGTGPIGVAYFRNQPQTCTYLSKSVDIIVRNSRTGPLLPLSFLLTLWDDVHEAQVLGKNVEFLWSLLCDLFVSYFSCVGSLCSTHHRT